MPMYEYRCSKCNTVFSVMQRMGAGAESLSCPGCRGIELTKLISSTFTPESGKAMPASFEFPAASMPKMGGGCGGGMCGSGMCGV